MATTLTLKNVPDEVYERLKWAAETHRRSINSEAILCLESVLTPARVSAADRIRRARQLREGLPKTFKVADIDTFKRAGRP